MCNPHRAQPPQAITPAGCGPASTTPTRGWPRQHRRHRPGLPAGKRQGVQGGSCRRVRGAPHHITRPQNRPPGGPGTAPNQYGAVGGPGSGQMPVLAPPWQRSGDSGLLSVCPPPGASPCESAARAFACWSGRGPYGGGGCWVTCLSCHRCPCTPFRVSGCPSNLYLPGRYPDKGENGPVRLRSSTGLNTIQLEFAQGKPLPATGSDPVAGVWRGLASVWSAD